MSSVENLYKEFFNFCSSVLVGENPKILDLIQHRYNECRDGFCSSQEMADLLTETRRKMEKEKSRLFVHLKEFTDVLKAKSKSKKKSGGDKKRKRQQHSDSGSERVQSETCSTSEHAKESDSCYLSNIDKDDSHCENVEAKRRKIQACSLGDGHIKEAEIIRASKVGETVKIDRDITASTAMENIVKDSSDVSFSLSSIWHTSHNATLFSSNECTSSSESNSSISGFSKRLSLNSHSTPTLTQKTSVLVSEHSSSLGAHQNDDLHYSSSKRTQRCRSVSVITVNESDAIISTSPIKTCKPETLCSKGRLFGSKGIIAMNDESSIMCNIDLSKSGENQQSGVQEKYKNPDSAKDRGKCSLAKNLNFNRVEEQGKDSKGRRRSNEAVAAHDTEKTLSKTIQENCDYDTDNEKFHEEVRSIITKSSLITSVSKDGNDNASSKGDDSHLLESAIIEEHSNAVDNSQSKIDCVKTHQNVNNSDYGIIAGNDRSQSMDVGVDNEEAVIIQSEKVCEDLGKKARNLDNESDFVQSEKVTDDLGEEARNLDNESNFVQSEKVTDDLGEKVADLDNEGDISQSEKDGDDSGEKTRNLGDVGDNPTTIEISNNTIPSLADSIAETMKASDKTCSKDERVADDAIPSTAAVTNQSGKVCEDISSPLVKSSCSIAIPVDVSIIVDDDGNTQIKADKSSLPCAVEVTNSTTDLDSIDSEQNENLNDRNEILKDTEHCRNVDDRSQISKVVETTIVENDTDLSPVKQDSSSVGNKNKRRVPLVSLEDIGELKMCFLQNFSLTSKDSGEALQAKSKCRGSSSLSSLSLNGMKDKERDRAKNVFSTVDTNDAESNSADEFTSAQTENFRRVVEDSKAKGKKPPSERHIRKLEDLLEKLRDEIEKGRDLTLDEMDQEDSFYIYEDKLKKKFVAAWTKLCEITNRTVTTGRPTERTIHYNGTRYREINRRLEKFLNKRKQFPDFQDVKTIIKLTNNKCNLHLSSQMISDMAREAFVDIGEMLQTRRHQDFIASFGSRQTDNYSYGDPAFHDPELRRKLDSNRKLGRSNLEAVINKYTELQYKRGTAEEGSSDDDEEEEEDDEIKKSKHGKKKKHKRTKDKDRSEKDKKRKRTISSSSSDEEDGEKQTALPASAESELDHTERDIRTTNISSAGILPSSLSKELGEKDGDELTSLPSSAVVNNDVLKQHRGPNIKYTKRKPLPLPASFDLEDDKSYSNSPASADFDSDSMTTAATNVMRSNFSISLNPESEDETSESDEDGEKDADFDNNTGCKGKDDDDDDLDVLVVSSEEEEEEEDDDDQSSKCPSPASVISLGSLSEDEDGEDRQEQLQQKNGIKDETSAEKRNCEPDVHSEVKRPVSASSVTDINNANQTTNVDTKHPIFTKNSGNSDQREGKEEEDDPQATSSLNPVSSTFGIEDVPSTPKKKQAYLALPDDDVIVILDTPEKNSSAGDNEDSHAGGNEDSRSGTDRRETDKMKKGMCDEHANLGRADVPMADNREKISGVESNVLQQLIDHQDGENCRKNENDPICVITDVRMEEELQGDSRSMSENQTCFGGNAKKIEDKANIDKGEKDRGDVESYDKGDEETKDSPSQGKKNTKVGVGDCDLDVSEDKKCEDLDKISNDSCNVESGGGEDRNGGRKKDEGVLPEEDVILLSDSEDVTEGSEVVGDKAVERKRNDDKEEKILEGMDGVDDSEKGCTGVDRVGLDSNETDIVESMNGSESKNVDVDSDKDRFVEGSGFDESSCGGKADVVDNEDVGENRVESEEKLEEAGNIDDEIDSRKESGGECKGKDRTTGDKSMSERGLDKGGTEAENAGGVAKEHDERSNDVGVKTNIEKHHDSESDLEFTAVSGKEKDKNGLTERMEEAFRAVVSNEISLPKVAEKDKEKEILIEMSCDEGDDDSNGSNNFDGDVCPSQKADEERNIHESDMEDSEVIIIAEEKKEREEKNTKESDEMNTKESDEKGIDFARQDLEERGMTDLEMNKKNERDKDGSDKEEECQDLLSEIGLGVGVKGKMGGMDNDRGNGGDETGKNREDWKVNGSQDFEVYMDRMDDDDEVDEEDIFNSISKLCNSIIKNGDDDSNNGRTHDGAESKNDEKIKDEFSILRRSSRRKNDEEMVLLQGNCDSKNKNVWIFVTNEGERIEISEEMKDLLKMQPEKCEVLLDEVTEFEEDRKQQPKVLKCLRSKENDRQLVEESLQNMAFVSKNKTKRKAEKDMSNDYQSGTGSNKKVKLGHETDCEILHVDFVPKSMKIAKLEIEKLSEFDIVVQQKKIKMENALENYKPVQGRSPSPPSSEEDVSLLPSSSPPSSTMSIPVSSITRGSDDYPSTTAANVDLSCSTPKSNCTNSTMLRLGPRLIVSSSTSSSLPKNNPPIQRPLPNRPQRGGIRGSGHPSTSQPSKTKGVNWELIYASLPPVSQQKSPQIINPPSTSLTTNSVKPISQFSRKTPHTIPTLAPRPPSYGGSTIPTSSKYNHLPSAKRGSFNQVGKGSRQYLPYQSNNKNPTSYRSYNFHSGSTTKHAPIKNNKNIQHNINHHSMVNNSISSSSFANNSNVSIRQIPAMSLSPRVPIPQILNNSTHSKTIPSRQHQTFSRQSHHPGTPSSSSSSSSSSSHIIRQNVNNNNRSNITTKQSRPQQQNRGRLSAHQLAKQSNTYVLAQQKQIDGLVMVLDDSDDDDDNNDKSKKSQKPQQCKQTSGEISTPLALTSNLSPISSTPNPTSCHLPRSGSLPKRTGCSSQSPGSSATRIDNNSLKSPSVSGASPSLNKSASSSPSPSSLSTKNSPCGSVATPSPLNDRIQNAGQKQEGVTEHSAVKKSGGIIVLSDSE